MTNLASSSNYIAVNTNKEKISTYLPSSPKLKQYSITNSNNEVKQATYKTHQKFSDYYPILTSKRNSASNTPAGTIPSIPAPLNEDLIKTQSENSLRTHSGDSIKSSSSHIGNNNVQPSPKLASKSHLRDSQWIKENIMRNLQTRKPLGAATMLNNTAGSAGSTDSNGLSLGSSINSYLLTPITAASTIKASTEIPTKTPPSTIKSIIHPSPSFRQNSNQRSTDGVKRVDFVNINETSNTSNMNSFQRLCELASRWNSKNRLINTQVIKFREKKYSSNSFNNINDNNIKLKQRKKRIKEKNQQQEEDTLIQNLDSDQRKRYTKLIAKNIIQLRPVHETDSFANINYTFNTDRKTPPLPQLQTMPTMSSITTTVTTTSTNASNENTLSSNNNIKWINNKNLIEIQQPVHVS